MNRYTKSIFLLLCIISSGAIAQNNKMLTVADAVLRQRTTLAPEKLPQLAFIPGTHTFAWIGQKNNKECLIIQQVENLQTDTVLTIDELGVMLDGTGTVENLPKRFPFINWVEKDQFRLLYNNAFYLVNIASRRIFVLNKILEDGENPEFESAGNKIAFTKGNNVLLFEQDTYDKIYPEQGNKENKSDEILKSAYLTEDGTYGIMNGQAVHRNEFGIDKGLFWSSKGARLAYYKMDERAVTDYPLLDLKKQPAGSSNIKYPMAGAQSHSVQVYIYDVAKKRQYPVLVGNTPDLYLTNIAFSPNEEQLFIAVLNRDQNTMQLNRYDATTGAFVKTLFTETSPKYVEPEHPVEFVKNKPHLFIWQSERDGYNHLYLYNHKGEVVRQLSKGNFDVTAFLGFNNTGTLAYYMAATNNGLDRQCFSVEIETGKTLQLTKAPGVHHIVLSDDGKYFIDAYSNLTTPSRITLMNNEGAELSMLVNALSPIRAYTPCTVKLSSIPSKDGSVKLNYRTIYPPQFDSAKKYPVLIYVYGGPHAQLITNSWLGGTDLWLYYMAQQGYVVFTLDNRGSANRGRDFEQATFRKLGTIEREDQLAGVEFLKKQQYVDSTRMGIFGWSFGGFMSINLMTRTDVFKAAVSGGPVIDWAMYEVMYTERYMDTPKDNADGYKDANLTNYVKNLKGKLMLIHGTDDDVVLWQHSLLYLKKCIEEDVQVDYFVYPGHKHNVLGKDRVHLMQKVADYFKENL